MDKTILFVYGTLKQGYGNHVFLKDSKFLGVDSVRGTLVDLGAFPGLLKDGDRPVYGELYEVDHATLRNCDRLEGHPNFYRREPVVTTGGVTCEVYYLQSHSPRELVILPGIWPAKAKNKEFEYGQADF